MLTFKHQGVKNDPIKENRKKGGKAPRKAKRKFKMCVSHRYQELCESLP